MKESLERVAAQLAPSRNIAAMGVAIIAADSVGVGAPQVTALTLECRLKSTPMAITLLVPLDLPAEAITPAAVYVTIISQSASFFAIMRARTTSIETLSGTPVD